MGTLFESAIGGFPEMESYGFKTFPPFGPEVDFEAGFSRPEQWQSEKRYSNLPSLSSETPELSSRPSSRSSSRPSSYCSTSRSSQRSSYSSLPDPEPYTLGLTPSIVDCDTIDHDLYRWTDYSIPEYSSWPPDHTAVDQVGLPFHEYPFAPSPLDLSSVPNPFQSFEAIQNLKPHVPTYSNFSGKLSDSRGWPQKSIVKPQSISSWSELDPDDSISSAGCSLKTPGRCPHKDCKRIVEDLQLHLLTHSRERREKCPITTCDYHIKGFCRKQHKHRHMLTHFKGTLSCNFCPRRRNASAKTFQRADVFKRHLVAVHGAENTPSPTSRKSSSSGCSILRQETCAFNLQGMYGNCSNCSAIFADPQSFYNHLDACVISSVLCHAPPDSTNKSQMSGSECLTFEADRDEKPHVTDMGNWVPKRGGSVEEGVVHELKRGPDDSMSWELSDGQVQKKKRGTCSFDDTLRLSVWQEQTRLATDLKVNMVGDNAESCFTDSYGYARIKPEIFLDEGYFNMEIRFPTYLDTAKGSSPCISSQCFTTMTWLLLIARTTDVPTCNPAWNLDASWMDQIYSAVPVTSLRYREPHRPPVVLPRKFLTDGDRRDTGVICERKPIMKETEIGGLFCEETSLVLGSVENYPFSHGGTSPSLQLGDTKRQDIETALVNWARNSEERGILLTDAKIREQAQLFARTVGSDEANFQVNKVSWLEEFKQKHGIITNKSFRRGSDITLPANTTAKSPSNLPLLQEPTRNLPLPENRPCATKESESLFAYKNYKSESAVKKETCHALSSCPDINNSNAESPVHDCGSFAPSPETDPSEDASDDGSISDCSTDWAEDENTDSPGSDVYRVLTISRESQVGGEINLIRPVLSPMKQALVDRIMSEFWTIVNQEWAANLTKCAGETPASSSPPGSNGSLIGGSSPRMTNKKHQRDDDEETPPDDDNGRNPKRPYSRPERSTQKSSIKFACPYRKHAPHRYTIYKHRSCALSNWDSVARVKEHLYRRHRVPIQCKRCWQIFKVQESLDAHLTVVNICSLQSGQATEGLTADLEKRLKSRKKSSPDQTEEARWKEIYGLLFPSEVVPNPYFEPVQENVPQSPDTRELAEYEEYSRLELPRVFRSYLEDAVNSETQHLEEHIRSRLVSIVQDCQAQMFSAYKSRVANKDSKSISDEATGRTFVTPDASQASVEEAVNTSTTGSKDIVMSAFQAPPPNPQSGLKYLADLQNVQASNLPLKNPKDINFSDSAYSGNSTRGSQSNLIQYQAAQLAPSEPPGDIFSQISLAGEGEGMSGGPDLSFDKSYEFPLDMNGQDIDNWWTNFESEA